MINMDMVGRLNEKKVLAISGVGTSPVWKEKLDQIEVAGIKITTSESGVGPSDHTSFYLKDIPVLHFFTGQHKEYHKPEDDSPLVNYQGIYEVSEFIIQLANALNLWLTNTGSDIARVCSYVNRHSFLTGSKSITLRLGSRTCQGNYRGVDSMGRLLIQNQGKIEAFSSGSLVEIES